MKLYKVRRFFYNSIFIFFVSIHGDGMIFAMNSKSQEVVSTVTGTEKKSWYSDVLAAMAAMMFGSSKIHQAPDNLTPEFTTLYPTLAAFIVKYSCSDDMKKDVISAIEHNPTQLKSRGFYEVNNFFIKGFAIDRLINAHRLQNYLKQQKFHNFKVAEKCLVYYNGSLFLISEKINIGDQTKKISLQEVKNVMKLTLDTGYWDWQFGDNIIRDIDNNLVFVDIEDQAFNLVVFSRTKKNLWYYLQSSIKDVAYDQDAFSWISTAYEKVKDEDDTVIVPLSKNSAYDDVGIDFEQVKKEFYAYEISQKKNAVYE